jgi:hypothetical protein
MGKIQGDDWFVHPIADCQDGIPPGTSVVVFTSNGEGLPTATEAQNDPACQASLEAFLARQPFQGRENVLIVDMGDNDHEGSFQAPGSVGAPSLVFPAPGDNATLTPAAKGPDGVLGTNDDHPIVKGPDGLVGTDDDLNDRNIDMCCSVAHGNLADGITLPGDATPLMTARFGGSKLPILAEYEHRGGLVILDTLTKEFFGHQPKGFGPSHFLRALFHYANSVSATPKSKAECKNGGYKEFGFKNQGQCVAFVQREAKTS